MPMGRIARGILLGLLLSLVLWSGAMAYQIEIAEDDLDLSPGLPEDVINILLIGTDSWEDVLNSGRSDTMIIASYRPEQGEVRLISLARDLLTEIPDGGGWNRLNAAHSFGGPNLLMKTLNRLLGLNVERYISLNIYGLERIIDAAGGLSMTIDEEEARAVNRMIAIEFPKANNPPCPWGGCVLTGLQAMTFARLRSLDNDFGRMARQQRTLLAMAEQAMSMEEATQAALIEACLRNISTNLRAGEIFSMAANVLAHGVELPETLTLPRKGTYIVDTLNGMSVLLCEEKTLRRDVRQFLYNIE